MVINITPKEQVAPPIEFNIVGVGRFLLPVLGQPGTPFGITSAFGVFMDASNGGHDDQKLAAWSQLIQALTDSYPLAVRVLGRLDGDDVAAVFTAWGEQSSAYDPKAVPSPASSTGTPETSGTTSPA